MLISYYKLGLRYLQHAAKVTETSNTYWTMILYFQIYPKTKADLLNSCFGVAKGLFITPILDPDDSAFLVFSELTTLPSLSFR